MDQEVESHVTFWMRTWKLLEATRLDDSELLVPLSEEFLGFESVCLGWFRGGLRD